MNGPADVPRRLANQPEHPVRALRTGLNTLRRGIKTPIVLLVTPHGPAIRALRKARGYSLRRLAHLVEKGPSTVARIESGELRCRDETTLRIAEALDVPIEAITRETL